MHDADHYLALLRRYAIADHVVRPAPRLAAWLSGQSAYRHSQLSAEQLAVLDELGELGYRPVRAGFPYNARALGVPYTPEPLVAASRRNTVQFFAALARPAFQAELARHLQPLIDAAEDRLLLVCGSCGLQLLAAALPRLHRPPSLRLAVVAVGPVCVTSGAFLRRQLDLFVVQGSRDWISRLGSRAGADARPPVDHLGYARHPEVRRVIRQAVLALG